MSKVTKCDCCGRSAPDILCSYQFRKRKWLWQYEDSWPESTSYRELDICDECWKWIISTVQNKFIAKEPGCGSIETAKPREDLKAPEYDKVSEGYAFIKPTKPAKMSKIVSKA